MYFKKSGAALTRGGDDFVIIVRYTNFSEVVKATNRNRVYKQSFRSRKRVAYSSRRSRILVYPDSEAESSDDAQFTLHNR